MNLAQHVEQGRVSHGQTTAWCVMGFCICFVIGLLLAGKAYGLP